MSLSSFINVRRVFLAGLLVLVGNFPGFCDFTSVDITGLKSPANFYTGKFIQSGDLEITVVSDNPGFANGLEDTMSLTVNLVSASGSCNSASPLSNDLSTSTLSDPSGRQIYTPQFYVLRPFTGQTARFQVTVSSADSSVLGRACSAAIDVYDYESSSIEALKTPSDYYTGKNINSSTNSVRVLVQSTASAKNFGLEDWMRVQVDLVTSPSGTTALNNDLLPSGTLTLTSGATTYTPDIRPERPFTGSSVRFMVTLSSANGTVLVPRTGTNPSYSSAINIYDYESSSAALLKTDFYTGKNANNTPGLRLTVVSTSAAALFGLEAWMAVHVAVVSGVGAGGNSDEVLPTTINMSTNSQNDYPVVRPQSPHTGSNYLYKLTITSANSTVALTPRIGTNPSFTSAINVYDYVLSSLTILSVPPIYVVNSTVNPSGVELVVRSTEADYNFGLEDYMRVSIDLLDGNNNLITSGVSAISPAVHATPGSILNYPTFYPKYSSGGSQTLKYRVTITSSTGSTPLTPQFGLNPATSTLVGVAPGSPSKLLILPLTDTLVRPSSLGRSAQYDEANPKEWRPTALGENLSVKVMLTDSWSNPVDIIPNTNFITFEAANYLTVPNSNGTGSTEWVLTPGYNGTTFELAISPWQVAVPIRLTSFDGYAEDTVYVSKVGFPHNTIFAGPSPFNPKIGETIRFGFSVDSDKTVKILVLDIAGRLVWETSVSATANFMNTSAVWDGRNGNGDLISAGVYWVVLEIDGDWKSKRKFGVIK